MMSRMVLVNIPFKEDARDDYPNCVLINSQYSSQSPTDSRKHENHNTSPIHRACRRTRMRWPLIWSTVWSLVSQGT